KSIVQSLIGRSRRTSPDATGCKAKNNIRLIIDLRAHLNTSTNAVPMPLIFSLVFQILMPISKITSEFYLLPRHSLRSGHFIKRIQTYTCSDNTTDSFAHTASFSETILQSLSKNEFEIA